VNEANEAKKNKKTINVLPHTSRPQEEEIFFIFIVLVYWRDVGDDD